MYLILIDPTSARMLFAYNRIQHINMHFFVSKDSMFSHNPRCFQKEILFRSSNMIHRHFHLWPWHYNESEYLGSNWPIMIWEQARIQQTNLYHALFFLDFSQQKSLPPIWKKTEFGWYEWKTCPTRFDWMDFGPGRSLVIPHQKPLIEPE